MRVLVLGGTGAMGTHVSRLLAEAGHDVFVTTRGRRDGGGRLRYVQGDAKDRAFLGQVLSGGWDVVVDFMVWGTPEFGDRVGDFLKSSGQYVFLSSYRVYADTPTITEGSPRLLDVVEDGEYLATDEYALSKARCEDMLFGSGRRNWTVVRPAITYDGGVGRLQLGVMESQVWLWRALHGIPIPMARDMFARQATMSYAGDVARMIVGLVGNPKAYGEAYTAATSEHASWREVADAYRGVLPMELVSCGVSDVERANGGVYQVRYDRMYDRVVDNTKVLDATGMCQSEMTPMLMGLSRELRVFLGSSNRLRPTLGENARYDRIVSGMPSLCPLLKDLSESRMKAFAKYVMYRFAR